MHIDVPNWLEKLVVKATAEDEEPLEELEEGQEPPKKLNDLEEAIFTAL